ncbi:MAG: sulfatase-like hydrolase/transferase [Xanthomonadales bacterium]|nr:sulfatase-like hydrolase/transferase [Xanthomonadales bacterium]
MPSQKGVKAETAFTRLSCHFTLWFGLVFATPLFISLHNIDGIALPPGSVARNAGIAAVGLSLLSWLASQAFPQRARNLVARFFLTLAFLLAIQGNWLYDLHGFGVFDGRPLDFRANSAVFWLDSLGWLALGAGLLWFFSRLKSIPAWLPALPVLSFVLLLTPALLDPPQAGLELDDETAVDPSVYAFSSVSNLVHLLPDGFQGDTVRQVLEENPGLAARFDGFTLFTNHLGRYPGTAPSLYSMLTGKAFPLEKGFDYSWVGPETKEQSYQSELARAGYQVDLVPISNYICPQNANSCQPRPFNNQGYSRHRESDISHSLRLLGDMTLFRLSPLFLKEKVYDRGYWLLSDIATDQGSPKPDPILREWTENLRVIDDRPVYKWYHYVGTHVPPRWDASCDLRRYLEPARDNYLAQAHCILNGIADFIGRLKAEGIYEQTAMIISGDHGHNTVPADQVSPAANYSMYKPLLGTGRPALLVKARGAQGPLFFSDKPTHLLNIMPTALKLAGLPKGGESVFEVPDKAARPRHFHHYPIDAFWSGKPVPYLDYTVGQAAHDARQWLISDMVDYGHAPREYLPVNKKTAKGFVYGARLRSSVGHRDSSWIPGRQLAFLIDIPDHTLPGTLEMELSLPPGIHSQSFTARVNGASAWSSAPFNASAKTGSWFTVAVPLDTEALRPGTNFISILFENLQEQTGNDDEPVSAKIRSIRARQP